MSQDDLIVILEGLEKSPELLGFIEEHLVDWLEVNEYIKDNKLTKKGKLTIKKSLTNP